jgi:thymidylate kinase
LNGIRKSTIEGSNTLKVVILGPDGAGKSSVIQGLLRKFELCGRAVQMRHLKPRMVAQMLGRPNAIDTDPHGRMPRGTLLSLVKIAVWLVEEWYANIFQEKSGTLFLCDRYYHDLLVDPVRYRFGAPLWTARLVGKLMPRPKLWILLDAPAEVLQARKQEVTLKESARESHAYRVFVRKQRKHAIVDASQPLDKVIADVETAINGAVIENKGHRG